MVVTCNDDNARIISGVYSTVKAKLDKGEIPVIGMAFYVQTDDGKVTQVEMTTVAVIQNNDEWVAFISVTGDIVKVYPDNTVVFEYAD